MSKWGGCGGGGAWAGMGGPRLTAGGPFAHGWKIHERRKRRSAPRKPFVRDQYIKGNSGRAFCAARGEMRRAAADTSDEPANKFWCATWAEGKKAAQKHSDRGRNPHCLWRAVPGSSERRNRARWQCCAHVECAVVLTLGLAEGGGFCLTCNGAQHGREPAGGPYRCRCNRSNQN